MTDFIPPSDPDRDANETQPPVPDWSRSPPSTPQWGQDPQTSPWGQAPTPSPWGPQGNGRPAAQGGGYGGDHGAGSYGQPQQGWVGQPYQGGHGGGQYPTYPRSSQATPALVLSVVGLFCCGLPAIIGTVMAKSDMNAINRGETDPTHHGTAQAGFIVGLIGSVLWLGMVAFWFIAILVSAAAVPA